VSFLYWLFPLWLLLPRARSLGSITFQTVEGVGWQCTIRPPSTGPWRRGAVNAWSGSGATLGRAVRAALETAAAQPLVAIAAAHQAPRLGGREFDDE
jgi:hypothetical protein